MERILWMPGMRAGLGAMVAAVVLLACAGTCVASGAPQGALPAKMADAAPLDLGSGFGAGREARRVKTLQRSLRRLGWAPGPVDGLFGQRTESAVRRFQTARGLAPDGVAGAATWRVLGRALERPLGRGAGFATPNGSPRVRALQLRLRNAGLRPGPIDGRYGPRTAAAVTRLRETRRVNTGNREPATRTSARAGGHGRHGASARGSGRGQRCDCSAAGSGDDDIRAAAGSVAGRPRRPSPQATAGSGIGSGSGSADGGIGTDARRRTAAGAGHGYGCASEEADTRGRIREHPQG